jgi:hypothetical protein
MFVVLLLAGVLVAVFVMIVVTRRNAEREAAGFPAFSNYRAPDPNAVRLEPSDARDNESWDPGAVDPSSGDSSHHGCAHGAVDGATIAGDVGADGGGAHGGHDT